MSENRGPVHDLDSEALCLSAVLDSPDGFDVVVAILEPEHFFSDANATILRAAIEAKRRGVKVTFNAVLTGLRDSEQLVGIGGQEYLHQIALETPYTHDLEAAARRVRAKHRVRRIVAECQRIAAEGYGDVGPIDEWIATSEAAIHRIAQDRADESVILMRDALERVFRGLTDGSAMRAGLGTGIESLDRIMGPMLGGQLIVLGALSGIGKTSLGLNVAMHNAGRGVSVAAFSAEMEAEELATRALFSDAAVDTGKVHSNMLQPVDWARLTASAKTIAPLPIYIDDRPSISVAQIRGVTRRMQSKATPPLGLIWVDYVQLIDGKAGLPRGATRENEVAEIARALKVLAKESGLPVLALAQLNSDSERTTGVDATGKRTPTRKPRMGDLRESKALGQHADKVILIHNPAAVARAEAYRMGDDVKRNCDLDAETVDLIVAKNRGGRTGTAQAAFWPSYTRFDELPASMNSDRRSA